MSYTNLIYHIVIRTKSCRRTIPPEHERDLYAYIFAFIKNRNSKLFRVNGMSDHVHILMSLHPSIALSDFVRDMKTATSKFMKARCDMFPMFEGWESEYYASTKSEGDKETVRQYIMNQKEHHGSQSFHDELLALCRENGISVDERYL